MLFVFRSHLGFIFGFNTFVQVPAQAALAHGGFGGGFTMEEVALHTTKSDCSVVVSAELLHVTDFLPEDPGGHPAIMKLLNVTEFLPEDLGGDAALMIFAGKDANEEFHIIHPLYVIPKYAPHSVNMQRILV